MGDPRLPGPDPATARGWHDYGWHAIPDPDAAAAEHAALRQTLIDAGADVVVGTTPVPGDPDDIYAYDPVLPTDDPQLFRADYAL